MKEIYTKEGKMNWLLTVSTQYEYMDYSWRGSVKDLLLYSIGKWNKRHPDKTIRLDELCICTDHLVKLDSCYFKNRKFFDDKKELQVAQDLKDLIL